MLGNRIIKALIAYLLFGCAVWMIGQSPATTSEVIDKEGGRGVSAISDADGNLHVSYTTDDGEVKYAFRPVGSTRWYTLTIGKTNTTTSRDSGGVFSRIAVDSKGNPQICFTSPGVQYARYSGGKWITQQLMNSVGVSGYACGIGIAPDDTPYVTWYQERDAASAQFDLHLKVATLHENTWLLKTIDYDTATGKWNQLVIDNKGVPHVVYSAFISGHLKYASLNDQEWTVEAVEAPTHKKEGLGMGNSIVLNGQGEARIAYYNEHHLKFARQDGHKWSLEDVDLIAPRGLSFEEYRSSIALDKEGNPYIAYENAGALKLAYFDGQKWNKLVLVAAADEPYLFSSIAITPDQKIHVVYRDPASGALTLITIPHPTVPAPAAADKSAAPNPTDLSANKSAKPTTDASQ